MNKYDACIAFLQRFDAHKIKHSKRTLLDHLVGTFEILQAASQPEEISFAGLFHSIYGTNAFVHQTLSLGNRSELVGLIGEQAEALAWRFCQLDRPQALQSFAVGATQISCRDGAVWDCSDALARQEAASLLTIEAANLLEQQVLWRSAWLIPHARRSGIVGSAGFSAINTSPSGLQGQGKIKDDLLDAARQSVRRSLIAKINEERARWTGDLIGSDFLREAKLQQALSVMQAHEDGSLESRSPSTDFVLVESYAVAYGASLLDAARTIIDSARAYQEMLVETEFFKDSISGELALATSLKEIERIRKGVHAWVR
jgi:hypothetical protein